MSKNESPLKLVDYSEEGQEHPQAKGIKRGMFIELGIINEAVQSASGPVVRTVWGEVKEVRNQKYRVALSKPPAFLQDEISKVDEVWVEPSHIRSVDI